MSGNLPPGQKFLPQLRTLGRRNKIGVGGGSLVGYTRFTIEVTHHRGWYILHPVLCGMNLVCEGNAVEMEL